MAKSKEKTAAYQVKYGSVVLTVKPWRHPSGKDYWRASYYLEDGKVRHITRADLAEAKAAAYDKAQELSKGIVDFNALAPHQIRAIKRMLEADPQLSTVDEFLTWHARKYPDKDTAEAVAEMIRIIETNKGDSIQHLRTMRKNLVPFGSAFTGRSLISITTPEIQDYLSRKEWGNRTRKNVRGSIVSFFRWASSSGYLPEGKTAAERVATPIVKKKTPETWTPEELAIMLGSVRPEYLTWLAATAFGGFRTDEIYPIAGGTKIPLDWSDFHWDRDLIIVRAETSKTARRVVPILPALKAWLYPCRKESGPVGAASAPPTKTGKGKDAIAETKRLGALLGGWRKNAIRHSWISYRAAIVGIGQTSMEAGNSESEAKSSYNDAKGKDEAERWFSVLPENRREQKT